MPDWLVSNGVSRYRPAFGPVSFSVSMSHAPVLGLLAANCVVRSAIDCC